MGTPVVHENRLHVYIVPDVDDLEAPTEAEITAGVDLTPALRADGASPNHTENTVSTDMLTGFIQQSVGTEGLTFNLTMQRYLEDGDDNAAWDYFDERGKLGFLIWSPYGPAESGAHVEVYPIETGRRKIIASGANAHQGFTVLATVTSDYEDDAEVAA